MWRFRTGSGSQPRGPETTTRLLAAVLCAVLILASIAPATVWAEVESEGEGAGPPGPPPIGLEEPGELGAEGEETTLEEVAPEGAEETEEEPLPLPSGEPPQEPEIPAAPPVAEEAGPPPAPEVAPPPVVEVPAPGYVSEAPAPEYQAAPAPEQVVENQPIVAPGPRVGGGEHPKPPRHQAAVPQESPPQLETESPPPEPEPTETVQPTPAAAADRPHSPAGSHDHTVRPGECLWTIAEGLLPASASDARIAAEVARLWRLNAERIGTGDPSLIMAGTVLRLG